MIKKINNSNSELSSLYYSIGKEIEIARSIRINIYKHLEANAESIEKVQQRITIANSISNFKRIKTLFVYIFQLLDFEHVLKEFVTEFNLKMTLEERDEVPTIIDYLVNYYNPIFDSVERHFESVSIVLGSTENHELRILEGILQNTPKILFDYKITPTKENDIQKCLYNFLVPIFPDTIREIPIPKIFKAYRSDFGIKHLKCLVEVKFVDSIQESKKTPGELYEDVYGYSGTEDWKIFYALIYMTEPFKTQAQIEEEFKLAKIENWKPIIVYGNGGRLKK